MSETAMASVVAQAMYSDPATSQWCPFSNGYSQISLYYNPETLSYRLIGQNLDDSVYIINAPMSAGYTKFQPASETFVSVIDGTNVFGFNFYAAADAKTFSDAFVAALAHLDSMAIPVAAAAPPPPPAPAVVEDAKPAKPAGGLLGDIQGGFKLKKTGSSAVPQDISLEAPSSSYGGPPPPPPPAPTASSSDSSKPAASGGSLTDALKGLGGVKLRKASVADTSEPAKAPPAAGGGNMMGEMAAKMKARKESSGIVEVAQKSAPAPSGGNMMGEMAAKMKARKESAANLDSAPKSPAAPAAEPVDFRAGLKGPGGLKPAAPKKDSEESVDNKSKFGPKTSFGASKKFGVSAAELPSAAISSPKPMLKKTTESVAVLAPASVQEPEPVVSSPTTDIDNESIFDKFKDQTSPQVKNGQATFAIPTTAPQKAPIAIPGRKTVDTPAEDDWDAEPVVKAPLKSLSRDNLASASPAVVKKPTKAADEDDRDSEPAAKAPVKQSSPAAQKKALKFESPVPSPKALASKKKSEEEDDWDEDSTKKTKSRNTLEVTGSTHSLKKKSTSDEKLSAINKTLSKSKSQELREDVPLAHALKSSPKSEKSRKNSQHDLKMQVPPPLTVMRMSTESLNVPPPTLKKSKSTEMSGSRESLSKKSEPAEQKTSNHAMNETVPSEAAQRLSHGHPKPTSMRVASSSNLHKSSSLRSVHTLETSSLSQEMQQLKQEIVAEVKRDIADAKSQIIAVFRQELLKLAMALAPASDESDNAEES